MFNGIQHSVPFSLSLSPRFFAPTFTGGATHAHCHFSPRRCAVRLQQGWHITRAHTSITCVCGRVYVVSLENFYSRRGRTNRRYQIKSSTYRARVSLIAAFFLLPVLRGARMRLKTRNTSDVTHVPRRVHLISACLSNPPNACEMHVESAVSFKSTLPVRASLSEPRALRISATTIMTGFILQVTESFRDPFFRNFTRTSRKRRRTLFGTFSSVLLDCILNL